jgi:hypothetical protein
MASNQMGSGNDSDDNVVKFPRDWLGPREELVPFGPSAGTAPPDDELPRSADDFWGEQSSAVHDAVRAPNGHAPLNGDPESFGARDGAIGPARRRDPGDGRLRGSLSRVRTSSRGGPARVSRLRARFRGRYANPKLAASIAAVAALFAGLLISSGTGQSPPTGATAHRSAQLVTTGSVASAQPLTRAPHLRVRTPGPASHRRSATSTRRHTREHRRHAGVRKSTRRSRSRPAAPATVQPVHYTTPASSSGTTGSSSSGTASSSPPVSSPSAAPASTAASGGRSATSSPAFGPNGTLGPGSSPDS